jgi:hypothetical protein
LTRQVRPVELEPGLIGADDLALLTNQPVAAYARDGRLVILARHQGKPPALMGTLSGTLQPVGEPASNLWGLAFELEGLESAILEIIVTADRGLVGYRQYRGRALGAAPPATLSAGSVERRTLMGTISGLRREIAIYRPAAAARRASRIMYVFDVAERPDSLFTRVDQLIGQGVIGPVIIVALPAGDGSGSDPQRASDARLQERVSGLNPWVYRQYERFIFEDLHPALVREFKVGADRNGVAFVGASASATWVLDQAARHASVARVWGAFALPDNPIRQLPGDAGVEMFMGGGTLDLEYLANGLTRCTEILRSGGRCRFSVVNSGHGQGAWDELTADLLIAWEKMRTRR